MKLSQESMSWEAPTEGTYKVNFDASDIKEVGTGLGMVARDQSGQIIATTTYLYEAELNFREVEVAAFRWTIIKANGVYLTDCLNLVHCWNSHRVVESSSMAW